MRPIRASLSSWLLMRVCFLPVVTEAMVSQVFDQTTGSRLRCPDTEIAGELSVYQCASLCVKRANCSGFNEYALSAGSELCELCNAADFNSVNLTSSTADCVAYVMSSQRKGYNCQTNNPCSDVEEFFRHELPNKYIQCGNSLCYEQTCPEYTVWEQSLLRCV